MYNRAPRFHFPRVLSRFLSISDRAFRHDRFHLPTMPIHGPTINVAEKFSSVTWYMIRTGIIERHEVTARYEVPPFFLLPLKLYDRVGSWLILPWGSVRPYYALNPQRGLHRFWRPVSLSIFHPLLIVRIPFIRFLFYFICRSILSFHVSCF